MTKKLDGNKFFLRLTIALATFIVVLVAVMYWSERNLPGEDEMPTASTTATPYVDGSTELLIELNLPNREGASLLWYQKKAIVIVQDQRNLWSHGHPMCKTDNVTFMEATREYVGGRIVRYTQLVIVECTCESPISSKS